MEPPYDIKSNRPNFKFLVFPILRSERLILRQLTVEDFSDLLQNINHPEISRRVINIPYPYTEAHAVHRISYVVQGFKKKERFVFAICRKEDDTLIGEISLHLNQVANKAEIGFWLGAQYWGMGYTTEAVHLVSEFGFTRLGLDRIFGTTHEDNIGSQKVLERNHYIRISTNGHVQFYERHRDIDKN